MAYSRIANWRTNILLVSLPVNGYYPPLIYAAPSSTLASEKPVFTMPDNADRGALLLPNIKDPKSMNAQHVCPGYLASDVTETTHDVNKLNLTVEYQSKDRLNVNIVPAHISRSNQLHYILPDHVVPRPKPSEPSYAHSGEIDLNFSWSNEPSFSFKVTLRSTGDVLFETTGTVLVFENQLVEFVSWLPPDYNLYGLGERIHRLRLGNNFTATIYAADVGDPIDTNLYGSHPFYLDTRYFEVPKDDKLIPATDNEHDPSRTIDLYFYSGPSQPEVTRSFQFSMIGLPPLQQYYTFGFHQYRWGYKSWTELEDVVSNFEKLKFRSKPFGYRDFEFDPNNYPIPEGQKFVSTLHQKDLHWIPMVDAASTSLTLKPPPMHIFLRNPDGSVYIGAVWPGYTVFPGFSASGSREWWSTELKEFFNKVPYDGIWIDMNEVSSFCVGSCGSGNLTLNPVHPPFQLPGERGNVIYDYPEGFNITNATEAASASSASLEQASKTGDLAVHAVSPNATSADGTLEYDIHNLFGHQLLSATYHGLLEVFPNRRPFIIGRSTFSGSGKWAGHWGGDNQSRWAYMFFSIPQGLSFSLFGIPMFGVDTYGFNGNSDEELCNR
ncbi:hypothetical protein BDBG_17409 [Blastomyces gilchristii SLH14081]|uniref:alpha-glucosidase n=1 Tax=Blastomyces gilchristii (strain SLH14081) TaxID=559298 RepID=A0A179URT4_BLAGS|nr:uncharacterized protein BDBG_17409 [Blastomyces gilchristii SLH14081]OAT10754.1 hypothetical protein BDBG_17409 [Blastomyces gilchristii SLH14081]